MSSAVTKLTSAALLGLAVAASSCSGDKDAAEALREQASAAIEASDPAGAIILLDSLDRAYPGEIETRRAAMPLRPKAIEMQTLRELEVNDSLIAATTIMIDRLNDQITFKQGAGGTDGYYVSKVMGDAIPSQGEGLYPRMSPEGSFYIISSARQGSRSTAVAVSAAGVGEASTPAVAHDGERNDRSLSTEVITFIPAECDTIGAFVLQNGDKPLTLIIKGEKGNRSIALPSVQAAAVGQLYAASKVFTQASRLALKKQALEQRLMLSRSQQARLMPD